MQNKALTLEELREMYGEPVWTVTIGVVGSGRWEIFGGFGMAVDGRDTMTLCCVSDGNYDCYTDTYGKTWFAYRAKSERSEGE